jgi:O-antigen ligase
MINKLEPALFAAYMAILVWAPLPFASNRIWSGALLAALVIFLLSVWLVLFLAGKVQLDSGVWRFARLPLTLLIIVQLWVLLQIQYLPRPVVEVLSPQAYQWHLKAGWLSLSLDREITRYYLLRGCTFTAGFFLTLVLLNTHQRVKILLQTLVFSGTFQATYGAFMVLSGVELGFFVEKYVGQGVATGTFVNRNHLAGYLVMTLSAGIGLLLSQLATTPSSREWKARVRRWLRLLLSSTFRLRIYLAAMVIALVLTRSRMGNVAFFSALGLAGAVALYTGRRFSYRVAAFLASLFVVDMVILGQWFGIDKLLARLEKTSPETEERVWSNSYIIDYIKEFPLTGSGGGSFYGVFSNFQAPSLRGIYTHADNDYLEFAAELGLPATMILIGFVALAFYHAFQVQMRRHTALYKGASFSVIMTILWAGIHSSTDFNLQIPANALTFVTILALAYVCRALPRP